MVPGICSNEHFLGPVPFITDYALCIWHQLRAGCNAWTRATVVASSRLQVFYRFSTLKKAANMIIVVCYIYVGNALISAEVLAFYQRGLVFTRLGQQSMQGWKLR